MELSTYQTIILLKSIVMKTNIFTYKGDYIYLLPTIAICIDEDYYPQYMEKYFLIKLSFLKGVLGIQITWRKQKTLD